MAGTHMLDAREAPQRGALVECNYDFYRERQMYGHKYPFRGDLLVINGVAANYSTGEWMVTFEELRLPIPLYAHHFEVRQTSEEGYRILRKVFEILRK